MAHEVRGRHRPSKGRARRGHDDRRPRPRPGRGARARPGLRRLPHRSALPGGWDQRRVPVPARPRGGRRRRGGRAGRHVGGAGRLRHPQLASRLRPVPVVPPGPAAVLLLHPQRHPEDDASPTARRSLRRSASARSPRRRSSPPASARKSTPVLGRRRPACSAAVSWRGSARRCSPARSASATRWRSSGAAASGARRSPAPAGRRLDRDRRGPRPAQARAGDTVRGDRHRQRRRTQTPSRRSGPSPAATAPTSASRRSATRR